MRVMACVRVENVMTDKRFQNVLVASSRRLL